MGLRFDDTLRTVLGGDVSTAFGKASAWRQLVDLIGRRRAAPNAQALALLEAIRDDVPLAVRVASTRALELAAPPHSLVALCARDDIAVAAPVLRTAQLSVGEWSEMLPQLSAAGRSVLRSRRDLPAAVVSALASFSGDFAIEEAGETPSSGTVANALPAEAPAQAPPAPLLTNTSFISIASAVRSIPVVADALKQVGEASAPELIQSGTMGPAASLAPCDATPHHDAMTDDLLELAPAAADRTSGGPFQISDVVARIDAFYTRQQGQPVRSREPRPADGFRFESDAQGVIRWVDGVSRAAIIGMSLDMTALAGGSGVDGAVAGAFRQRAAFSDARLMIAGESDAAGAWRISGMAIFDPASGRFAGYRGSGRRPRAEESPISRSAAPSGAADSMRQLMHELRTPTNAIAGFAEMIERQMLGDAPAHYCERAAMIRDQARALLGAIDDLDLAARMEVTALQLQARDVALEPILTRVAEDLAPLADARGAALVLPTAAPGFAGDPRASERLVSRLIATVLAAAGSGEQIAVSASEAEGSVWLSVTRPLAWVGLSDEALAAIDDELGQGALLGTGFAVRLLRNLTRELGGGLSFEADRVIVRLPATVTKSLELVR